MANSLMTISGLQPPEHTEEKKPMSKDTRCWGYKADPDSEQGYIKQIFPDEAARKAAGFVDTPAGIVEAKEKAEAAARKKAPHKKTDAAE